MQGRPVDSTPYPRTLHVGGIAPDGLTPDKRSEQPSQCLNAAIRVDRLPKTGRCELDLREMDLRPLGDQARDPPRGCALIRAGSSR
jgi:hypothetical protein